MTSAAVLGGGPSLPNDLKMLPADCVLISVNDHALYHCTPQYLVHMDILRRRETANLSKALELFQGIVVSPFENSHVTLPNKQWWDGGFSSTLALWFGLWMDCDPVILCGMDCYQGPVKYCHPREGFEHPVLHQPIENHLHQWKPAFKKCPHPERIRAASGPLIELFGEYQPAAGHEPQKYTPLLQMEQNPVSYYLQNAMAGSEA